MKFVVEVATKCPARLGSLIHSESGKKFPTPLLVHNTKSGSIPFLSKEVFNFSVDGIQVLQMSLDTCDHMGAALEMYGKGINSFVGYESYPTIFLLKNPSEITPSGFHEKDMVPIFTRKGKATISVDRYMNFIKGAKPNIYASLYDSDTNIESSKKRIFKSVERTEKFFKECLKIHKTLASSNQSLFLAPIVGGYNKEARSKCIKVALQEEGIGGYLIDGFHNNGVLASEVNLDKMKDTISYCIAELENEKLKIFPGAYTPLAIVEMIQLGIDVFDTSYIYIMTENFYALTFNFNVNSYSEKDVFKIDLKNERFKEDFAPVLNGCICMCCKKHTRAYIHHLVQTKELLGPILLMIHNTHHYLRFFEEIRQTIPSNKLFKLINILKHQMEADM